MRATAYGWFQAAKQGLRIIMHDLRLTQTVQGWTPSAPGTRINERVVCDERDLYVLFLHLFIHGPDTVDLLFTCEAL